MLSCSRAGSGGEPDVLLPGGVLQVADVLGDVAPGAVLRVWSVFLVLWLLVLIFGAWVVVLGAVVPRAVLPGPGWCSRCWCSLRCSSGGGLAFSVLALLSLFVGARAAVLGDVAHLTAPLHRCCTSRCSSTSLPTGLVLLSLFLLFVGFLWLFSLMFLVAPGLLAPHCPLD